MCSALLSTVHQKKSSSIHTGCCINGRSKNDTMNVAFFWISQTAQFVRKRWQLFHSGRRNGLWLMIWENCRETQSPLIHEENTFSHTPYQRSTKSIYILSWYLFFLQQGISLCLIAKNCTEIVWYIKNGLHGLDPAIKLQRTQSEHFRKVLSQ